jgi:C1A family cysteine protease
MTFKTPVIEEEDIQGAVSSSSDQPHLLGSSSPLLGATINLDWRNYGAVTPIRNQGKCSGCYAFSSAAAMEGAYKIKTG